MAFTFACLSQRARARQRVETTSAGLLTVFQACGHIAVKRTLSTSRSLKLMGRPTPNDSESETVSVLYLYYFELSHMMLYPSCRCCWHAQQRRTTDVATALELTGSQGRDKKVLLFGFCVTVGATAQSCIGQYGRSRPGEASRAPGIGTGEALILHSVNGA